MTNLADKLRNSDLVIHDGCVFVNVLFKQSDFNDLRGRSSAPQEIERYINHLHMFMVEEGYDAQRQLAQELKNIWERKALDMNHPAQVEILDNGSAVDICLVSK